MDSGCGHDIISRGSMTKQQKGITTEAADPIVFETANGSVETDKTCPLHVPALGEEYQIDPYVLPDTPDVLTIGGRCELAGLRFLLASVQYGACIDPARCPWPCYTKTGCQTLDQARVT